MKLIIESQIELDNNDSYVCILMSYVMSWLAFSKKRI